MIRAANNDSTLFSDVDWNLVRNVLIAFVFVFWLAVAYWVYKDARRRIENRWLIVLATVLGLVPPFVGALVYMLFRPPEYLDDVRERELEIQAMEDRLAAHGLRCPVCRANVEANFLVCPVCTTRLRHACESCNAPLEPLWQVCPFCETAIESRTRLPPEPSSERSRSGGPRS